MPAAYATKSPTLPHQDLINLMTDATRWQILGCLEKDAPAGQIAEQLGMKPANVQYHLKILVEAGLVEEFPDPDLERRFLYRRKRLGAQLRVDRGGMIAQVTFA